MTQIEFNTQLTSAESYLKRFAYSLTAGEDAKDLIQETYLKALRYKDQFQNNTNFKSWLMTIMKNTFINNYRKNKRSNLIFDSNKDTNRLTSIKGSQFRPEENIVVEEIDNKIKQLNPEFKKPFEMFNDGYKYHEISDEMGLPIGTVKSRIFHARKKLASSLQELRKSA